MPGKQVSSFPQPERPTCHKAHVPSGATSRPPWHLHQSQETRALQRRREKSWSRWQLCSETTKTLDFISTGSGTPGLQTHTDIIARTWIPKVSTLHKGNKALRQSLEGVVLYRQHVHKHYHLLLHD